MYERDINVTINEEPKNGFQQAHPIEIHGLGSDGQVFRLTIAEAFNLYERLHYACGFKNLK
jgi:hypothetical protein